MFGMYSGYEVDEKRDYVECEDERDGPFQNCSCVIELLEIAAAEGDGEDDLDKDEGQFYPEGYAKDAVLAKI